MPDRPRPSFAGMVAGEVVKLTRQRALWAILGAGVLLFAFVVVAMTSAEHIREQLEHEPLSWARNEMDVFGLLGQVGTGIVVLIAASRLYGMEYSSGTIRVLLARGAGRLQIALAKAVVVFAFGIVTAAVYSVLAIGVCLIYAQAHTGSLSVVRSLPSDFFQDVGRWAAFQVLSVAMAVLIAWAAAAVGRSLAFAMGVAISVYPATNFLEVIMTLASNATHHDQPWRQISDALLGGDMNYLLKAWEPLHWSTTGFGKPMDVLTAGQTLLALALWAVVLLALAIYRTAVPDVLE